MRPPGIDILLTIVAAIGAVIVSVQPVTDPASFSRGVLDPTLLALVIFLAARSTTGVASLTESGIMSLYMSYPLSRPGVFLVLLISRVLLPSALMLFVPLLTALITLKTTMLDELKRIALFYLAFLIQALFYGSLFLFIALLVKSQAVSAIAGVTAYFIVVALNTVLPLIGTARDIEFLVDFGSALSLPDIVYQNTRGAEPQLWQYALIPFGAVFLAIVAVLYFSRRFEPK
ncbi:MAG: hypothetical protein QXP48_02435 [Acidilobaceae archaeon]